MLRVNKINELCALVLAFLLYPPIRLAAEPFGQYKWQCGSPDFLSELVVDRQNLKLNNFILTEGDSETIKGFRAANFNFTVVNRSDKIYKMSYQLVGLAKSGETTFVISGTTGFLGVQPNNAIQVGAGVHVQDGDLGRSSKLCIRLIGAFQ